MANGWNLWVWVECIGMVSVPLVLAFLQQHRYFLFIFSMLITFFRSFYNIQS